MKTYYICAAIIFLVAYSIFHFGFREVGAGRLYRINDRLAFEVQPENENYNGITFHGYKRTNRFICFFCGEYEPEDRFVWMVNVKYRRGDWVYTDFPQHEQAKTDIVNLRTGEAIEVNLPEGFTYGGDISTLPEYQERGLVKADEFKLDQTYVKANFEPLSTFTDRCLYAHLIFAVAALFLAYPKMFLHVINALAEANDPTKPENYYRIGN